MIRKFYLFVFLCSFCITAFTAPVDVNLARKVAVNFYYGKMYHMSPDPQMLSAEAPQLVYTSKIRLPNHIDSVPSFYIFNIGQGFVMVSADSREKPILGYSLYNSFQRESFPSNMSYFLNCYNSEIKAICTQVTTESDVLVRQWTTLLDDNYVQSCEPKRGSVVGPLIETQWAQTDYYNDKCPVDATAREHTLVGCVAVAMGQLIRYWQYPTQGRGEHSYSCSYGTQYADYEHTTYDFANMPKKLSYASTQAQIDAVSTLLYQCGVSVDMDYGLGGSGSVTEHSVNSLINYFGYPNTMEFKNKSDNEANWVSMLKAELNLSHPIIYSGRDAVSGHAFILDGYDSDDMFHVNWGWGGNYDGYFQMGRLNGGPYQFNNANAALFGLCADQPKLMNNSNEVEFLAETGSYSAVKEVSIYGPALTRVIAVNAPEFFQVSTDNVNFSSSVLLPSKGGILYVRFNATDILTATSKTGNLVLSTYGADNDTIKVSGFTYSTGINPPQNLMLTQSDDNIVATWDAPDNSGNANQTLTLNDKYGYVLGYGTTAFKLAYLHRYTTSDLYPYHNAHLTSISFPCTPSYSTGCVFHVVAYTGGGYQNGEFNLGTLVVDQLVESIQKGWNLVTLTHPIAIDASQTLYVGVYIEGPTGTSPMSFNYDVPANPTKSDIFVVYGSSINAISYVTQLGAIYGGLGDFAVKIGLTREANQLLGYNVRRDDVLLTGSPIAETRYVDPILSYGNHHYEVSAVYDDSEPSVSNDITVVDVPEENIPECIGYEDPGDAAVFPIEKECQILLASEYFDHVVPGQEVTSVTFETAAPTTDYLNYQNDDFIIKIYEGGKFGGNLLTVGYTNAISTYRGKLISQQNYSQTTYGAHTVVLDHPYTIKEGTSFWIAIETKGKTLFKKRIESTGEPVAAADYKSFKGSNKKYLYTKQTQKSDGSYVDYLYLNYTSGIYTDATHEYVQQRAENYMLSFCTSVKQELVVTPTLLEFYNKLPEQSLEIFPNISKTEDWVISSDASWLTITPTRGNGFHENVTVHASANNTDYKRYAIITVTQGDDVKTVAVIQSEANEIVLGTNSDLEVKLFDYSSGSLKTVANPVTLNATDNLLVYPFYRNNGPNAISSAKFNFYIKAGDDNRLMYRSSPKSLNVSTSWTSVIPSSENAQRAFTIPASKLNEAMLYGTFPITIVAEFEGVDPDLSNNSFTINVNRTQPTVNLVVRTDNSNINNPGEVWANGGWNTAINFNASLGANTQIKATPNYGMAFTGWYTPQGDEISKNAEYEFVARENREFVARFVRKSHNVSVLCSPTAGGSITGAGTYYVGDTVTVTRTDNHGYYCWQWNLPSVDIVIINTYDPMVMSFIMPDFDVQVQADYVNIMGVGALDEVTACERYIWSRNGQLYTESGEYMVSRNATVEGHVVTVYDTLRLTINKATAATDTKFIVENQLPYTWNGVKFTEAGTKMVTLTNAKGCDSVLTMTLVVYKNVFGAEERTICDSELPYNWDGIHTFAAAGEYKHLMKGGAVTGADSTATLTLKVNATTYSEESATACEAYTWHGETYTESGDYQFKTQNVKGCDSLVTLHLTINRATAATDTKYIVENQLPYTWNGVKFTDADTKTVTLTNTKGCDSVLTMTLYVYKNVFGAEERTICDSELPYNWDGIHTFAAAGEYKHLMKGGAATGADSTATLTLKVNATTYSEESATACEAYTWHGETYTESGDYQFKTQNVKGCDSIVTLHLTINRATAATDTKYIVENQLPYTWNGVKFTEAGTKTVTLTNAKGCDSVLTMTLYVYKDVFGAEERTICDSELPYNWDGIHTFAAAGEYKHLMKGGAATGADSTATLTLKVNATTYSEESATACEAYTWHGKTYTESGDYQFKTQNSKGCDSLVILHLTINKATYFKESATACEAYTWHGKTYTESGDYQFKTQNSKGCDSLVTLHLTINRTTAATDTKYIVENQLPYTWNGVKFTEAGTKTVTLTNAKGCDSVLTMTLVVYKNVFGAEERTICDSELPYNWDGIHTFAAAGEYKHLMKGGAATGADSTATLTLKVNATTYSEESATACDMYTWHGKIYTESGDYQFKTQNSKGCDSLVILHLTINKATYSEESATACEAYIWHGATYTESGNYQFKTQNLKGCDSIVTLHLTINETTAANEKKYVVENQLPYTWNGVKFTAAGTKTVTLTNVKGCDSILTMTLVVSKNVTGEEQRTICDVELPYNWDNIHTFTQAGEYQHRIPTGAYTGADSTAVLILNVNATTYSEESATACDLYNWHGETYTESGDYQFKTQNSKGCDSLVTLHLTINKATYFEESATACEAYNWHGETYTESGDYQFKTQNAKGCDSLVTLHLTINRATAATDTKYIVENQLPYTWNGIKYTDAGTKTVTLTNAKGCDSVQTMTLVVYKNVFSYEERNICDSELPYNWDGIHTFAAAGEYKYLMKGGAATGADSTATLTLKVNATTYSEESVTACDMYTWHGETYTESGDYQYKTQNAKGCDSLVTLHLTINRATAATDTKYIVENQLPYTWNGVKFTEAGTKTVTLTNAKGCDSVLTMTLYVYKNVFGAEERTICDSELPYNWDGIHTFAAAGEYRHLKKGGAATGADSTATLTLKVNATTYSEESATACEAYTWHGKTYTESGDYQFKTQNAKGCDSLVTLHLTINRATAAKDTKYIVENQLPYTWNGVKFTEAGTKTVTLTNAKGCDSLLTMTLYVNKNVFGAEERTICDSELPYNWDGIHMFAAAGEYKHLMKGGAATGADSTATLTLKVNATTYSEESATACDLYTWQGKTYTESGDYQFKTQNAKGCDSIVTLHLTINKSTAINDTKYIVENQLPYTWNGVQFTEAGTKMVTLTNAKGCDSVLTMTLYVYKNVFGAEERTICDSELPYNWDGIHTFAAAGEYKHLMKGGAVTGADSTATLTLKVNATTYSEESVTACGMFVWNGETYTESGDYKFKVQNSKGCDSIVTLHLTVNPTYAIEKEIYICEYELPYIYEDTVFDVGTKTGDYILRKQTEAGCDSIITLHVSLFENLNRSETVVACDSYLWEANGETYKESGIYTFDYNSDNACPVVDTLYLTIHHSAYINETEILCSSDLPYKWHNRNLMESGIYYDTLQTVNDCDSITILHLTINPTYNIEEDIYICEYDLPYIYKDTIFDVGTKTGDYIFKKQTISGCDSIITLHVSFYENLNKAQIVEACDSYVWEANGETYKESGIYTFDYNSDHVCPKVDTLYLTIHHSAYIKETEDLCASELPYMWNGRNLIESGVYYDTLNTVDGCDSIIELTLTVYENPEVVISGNTEIMYGDSTILMASGAITYLWSTGEETESIIVAPKDTMIYSVIGKNEHDCTGYDVVTVNVSVGISDPMLETLLSIYPNPVKDYLTVETAQLQMLYLEIYNSVGALVGRCDCRNNESMQRVNVNHLAPGSYFLSVTTDKGKVVKKFVK